MTLDLSTRDVELLYKLKDAGLIKLDGLQPLSNEDPALVDWTYKEFLRDMTARQKLRAKTPQGRDSTARCRLRYVEFLETYEPAPVALRPPSEDSWLDHVHHRIEEEDIAGTALNQYRKALKSLLSFLGVPPWESLNRPFEETPPHWTLPDDEAVRRFWMDRLHGHQYLAATYAYIFHFGFHVGVRPPSEICALRVDDVDFSGRSLVITEVKKGSKRRTIEDVEDFILSAHTSKSLRNYLEHWRPIVDTGEDDAFFLNTEGRRFCVQGLGADLGKLGRTVWPRFTPYTMRRWFATEFLIANDFNVYATAERLGDTVATVERHYLDKARARAAMVGHYRMKQLRGTRHHKA